MPNHVINEVTLHDVTLERCGPKILDKEGNIDFSILLPLSLHFWPGSYSIAHQEAFPGVQMREAVEVWGTKWNAYGQNEQSVEHHSGNTLLEFQTAWGPPRGWIVALFNTLECDISAGWLSEGARCAYVETYKFKALEEMGGEAWSQREIEPGRPEYRRLHKLLWGVEAFDDDEDAA